MPKIQKATLIMETSEKWLYSSQSEMVAVTNVRLYADKIPSKLGSWDIEDLHSNLVFDTTTKLEVNLLLVTCRISPSAYVTYPLYAFGSSISP